MFHQPTPPIEDRTPKRTSEPPQEIAMRKEVADAVKRKDPIQSMRPSFSCTVASLGLSVRRYGTETSPKAKMGNMR